jgi:hypothetical protein
LASVADKDLTADSPFVRRRLAKLNIGNEKLLTIKKAIPLPKYHSHTNVISLREICSKVRNEIRESANYSNELKIRFLTTAKYKKQAGASIIFYGKNGTGKRTKQILLALEKLASTGFEFRIISIFCGRHTDVMEDLNFILSSPHLSKRSICLPPLAPWIVPGLLKSSDIGICGESNFSVAGHLSILPIEMLNSGLALVTSKDMLQAPFYRWTLRQNLNVVVAHNDNYYTPLRLLLENPSIVNELKVRSKQTSRIIESSFGNVNPIVAEVENWLASDLRNVD